jgi:hypothetical protein
MKSSNRQKELVTLMIMNFGRAIDEGRFENEKEIALAAVGVTEAIASIFDFNDETADVVTLENTITLQ